MNLPDVKVVKSTVRIEDVLGDYGIPLKPFGKGRLVGKCPFHQEKTASFVVYYEPRRDQHATCFGCHWSGDPIKLVQELDGVDFKTAVRRLVDDHGAHNVPKQIRRKTVQHIAAVQRWWGTQLDLAEEAIRVLPEIRNRGYRSEDDEVILLAIAAEKTLDAAVALSDELRDYEGPEIVRLHGAFGKTTLPSIRRFYAAVPVDLRLAWLVQKWVNVDETVAAACGALDELENEFFDLDPVLFRRIDQGRQKVLANARHTQNRLTGVGDRRRDSGAGQTVPDDIRPAA